MRARPPGPPLLLAPPARIAGPSPAADDRRGTEGVRGMGEGAKVTALRNYRRAKGLCFKCGERWGHDHICPPTVKLHVIEEFIDLFNLDVLPFPEDTETMQPDNTTAEQVWRLSVLPHNFRRPRTSSRHP